MSVQKLHHLCYYAQARGLAWTGKPLFHEKIEARINGPFIPALHTITAEESKDTHNGHTGTSKVGVKDLMAATKWKSMGLSAAFSAACLSFVVGFAVTMLSLSGFSSVVKYFPDTLFSIAAVCGIAAVVGAVAEAGLYFWSLRKELTQGTVDSGAQAVSLSTDQSGEYVEVEGLGEQSESQNKHGVLSVLHRVAAVQGV